MKITLTPGEMMSSGQVGLQRHIANIAAGRADKHGATPGDFGPHVIGAMGEMAVAKCLGTFWSGSTTFATRHAGDLPGGVEVRTTTHANGSLILHPTDPDDRRYVLVIAAPPVFTVAGWIVAREGKVDACWRDPTGKNRPAWFVPASGLYSMERWSTGVDPLRARVTNDPAIRRLVAAVDGQVESVERSRIEVP